ncbi:MAG: hypothetical protein WA175_00190 [Candidatus Acidiferrales bacterium]
MEGVEGFRAITRLLFIVALAASAVPSYARGETASPGAEVLPNGDVRVQGSGARPELFFACDLKTDQLESFFSNTAMVANLKELNAGIALGISDFSPARAQVVRQLNQAGIPVIAGLMLPGQGVYLNAGNAPEAAARFAKFESWTTAYGLKWSAVGLDIEPNLKDFADIRNHRLRLAARLLRRSFDAQGVRRAREAYAALIATIHSDGYPVETIQMNFLADERRVHTTILERLFGIVDARADDEVLMVYSSFNHAAGGAVVWSYGPDAQAIAIGSTAGSGDPALDAKFGPLNWGEFSRDLIIASHFSRLVGVYNLQGCIRQGFLERLNTLDWNQSVTIPASSIRRVKHFRQTVEAVLWLVSRLPYFLAAGFVLIAVLIWRHRAKKPSETRSVRA